MYFTTWSPEFIADERRRKLESHLRLAAGTLDKKSDPEVNQLYRDYLRDQFIEEGKLMGTLAVGAPVFTTIFMKVANAVGYTNNAEVALPVVGLSLFASFAAALWSIPSTNRRFFRLKGKALGVAEGPR